MQIGVATLQLIDLRLHQKNVHMGKGMENLYNAMQEFGVTVEQAELALVDLAKAIPPDLPIRLRRRSLWGLLRSVFGG